MNKVCFDPFPGHVGLQVDNAYLGRVSVPPCCAMHVGQGHLGGASRGSDAGKETSMVLAEISTRTLVGVSPGGGLG